MQRIEQNKSVFLEPRRKAEFNPVSCYLCLFVFCFFCLFVCSFVCLFVCSLFVGCVSNCRRWMHSTSISLTQLSVSREGELGKCHHVFHS